MCSRSPAADSDAQEAFDREHWEEVAGLLQNQTRSACDDRLLALAWFQSNQFDTALPQVQSLRASTPNDRELDRAALTMLTAMGHSSDARQVAASLLCIG